MPCRDELRRGTVALLALFEDGGYPKAARRILVCRCVRTNIVGEDIILTYGVYLYFAHVARRYFSIPDTFCGRLLERVPFSF